MNNLNTQAPVITIDGPSGVGKGTIALRVAQALGWYLLDSGTIYRAIAWALTHYKVSMEDTEALARLLKRTQVAIENGLTKPAKVLCDGHDITQSIRVSTMSDENLPDGNCAGPAKYASDQSRFAA